MGLFVTPSNDCCSTSACPPLAQAGPPGPAGIGTPGADGSDGVNAYTLTSLQFTMPAVAATVQITVADTSWIAVGQNLFVQSAGYFSVTSVDSAILVTIENLGADDNAAPTTVINGGRKVSPGGYQGEPGPVTSVGLTMPSIFSVANSPVTGSDTIAVTSNTQNANLVYAGPNTGAAATPSFRALVPADIPTGIPIGSITGTLPINQGGTGQTAANPAFNALSPLTTKGDLLGFSTVNARLAVGTDGQALIADAASTLGVKWATIQGVLGVGSVSHTLSSGTDGGSFTSGSWATRVINTVDGYTGITTFSLASNVLSLSDGTYVVIAWSTASGVDSHQMRIARSGGTYFYGSTELAASGAQTRSTYEGVVTISSQTLTLEHRCSSTKALNGFGSNAGFGNNEVYARVVLIKIA